MGLFVTLAEPTAPMTKEAASAGVLDPPFGKFARLQMPTIEDLIAGETANAAGRPRRVQEGAREEDKTRQAKLL